jgi:hypothetical protein
MKQKLFIFLGLIILIIALIGLNAASYTQKEKMQDSEIFPNRSTYNSGATGTKALFDLLAETGRKPVRWTEPANELLKKDSANTPSTFVIIGQIRQDFSDGETEKLLEWVANGGKLVIIDREPSEKLIIKNENWQIHFKTFENPFFDTDTYDQKAMTFGTNAAKPVQPSIFVKNINAVQPSRFASTISFDRFTKSDPDFKDNAIIVKPKPIPTFAEDEDQEYEPPPKTFPTPQEIPDGSDDDLNDEPYGLKREQTIPEYDSDKSISSAAPFVHLANDKKNILVEIPHGSGQIVILSDPYIVSNVGIGIADNVQIAVNILTSREGIIAFDEYHQGFGASRNRLLEYFAGTPVTAIFLQITLLIVLIFFSQSRRFARAVPKPEPDRLSKLEYVSAMAEMQRSTKGYDLAIENIYSDFRRRVSRLVGVDALATRKQDLALLIVERLPDENAAELEQLMEKCEDVMHSGATGKKEVLRLTTRLRELEEKLGLQRRKRQRKAV